MPKFRKKPVEITAEQWFPYKYVKGVKVPVPGDGGPYVVTIHGAACPVQPGDWIIPEPDGIHFYPCKPDIFEKTYEAVHE
ncbi:MAG: hypothetical protein NVS3B25_19190 [Hymenobacter sp.]